MNVCQVKDGFFCTFICSNVENTPSSGNHRAARMKKDEKKKPAAEMMRGGQNLSAACALVSARRAKLFISTPSAPLPEKIPSVLKLW